MKSLSSKFTANGEELLGCLTFSDYFNVVALLYLSTCLCLPMVFNVLLFHDTALSRETSRSRPFWHFPESVIVFMYKGELVFLNN